MIKYTIEDSLNRTIILPVVLYGYETFSYTKGRAQTEVIWEQGAEENIWT
jgi:hypothetical protein